MQLNKYPKIDRHSSYQPWLGARTSTEFALPMDWFPRSLPIRRFENERQRSMVSRLTLKGEGRAHVVAHRPIELGEELNHPICGHSNVNDEERPMRWEEAGIRQEGHITLPNGLSREGRPATSQGSRHSAYDCGTSIVYAAI